MTHVHGVDDGHGYGMFGESNSKLGVKGQSNSSFGVYGISNSSYGVVGYSQSNYGVFGRSESGYGMFGASDRSYGLFGYSTSNYAVYGYSNGGLAAYLEGNVRILGNLHKSGGSFKIDHPLDPANKYLYHSFVESPDMKNVYDGVVMLDNKGEAEIDLPDWFGALNKDFRYQLTAIGAPGPNLYIAEKISDTTTSSNKNSSRFKIAGGTSGMEVKSHGR